MLNLGIVRAFGKQDLAGATKAWQQVVEHRPGSPEGQAAKRALDAHEERAPRRGTRSGAGNVGAMIGCAGSLLFSLLVMLVGRAVCGSAAAASSRAPTGAGRASGRRRQPTQMVKMTPIRCAAPTSCPARR